MVNYGSTAITNYCFNDCAILEIWNGLNILELTVKLASSTDEIFVVWDSSLDIKKFLY
jgi:hypothetical protein